MGLGCRDEDLAPQNAGTFGRLLYTRNPKHLNHPMLYVHEDPKAMRTLTPKPKYPEKPKTVHRLAFPAHQACRDWLGCEPFSQKGETEAA